ncbi:MAG: DUF87 domain-containing protein [Calditrichaeota bacterium]|nr:DUF87 domain-containing protein [Calditrichota bacterium]
MQREYEKLGQFYLGKKFDLSTRTLQEELVLYDSKDLTTHAVIIGMTGSGKTGLGIGLIEEALIDGVPVLAIDPKGDIPNLLLTFPDLSAERLQPWVNPQEAAEKGLTPEAFAAEQAELWQKGLQSWHQDLDRIRRLRESSEMVVYTPGSQAGVPVSVLRNLAPPPPAVLEDADLFREQLEGTTTSLLSLVGLEGNPTQDREFVLVANILKQAWLQGQSLSLADLIRAVQKPPFQQVGVFDLESFYPAKERFQLALQLNNLLAAPGFEAWTQGVPLNIPRFLFTPEGKPKASIFTISHLSEHERMFFVSTLLNAVVSWVRSQPGTSSLRALLYMDEVFGYLPPVKNPPSKAPLLTLLKQARASGLGVVLSTQNPVDLDYKALSNAGTWFVGRLQTERDKERVLEGLEGAAAGGQFDRERAGQILAGLGKRVFYLHNVHEHEPTIFQTRWVLSYLSGPMTREQIRRLMAPVKEKILARQAPASGRRLAGPSGKSKASSQAPSAPPGVPVFFVPSNDTAAVLTYFPALLGYARVRYGSTRYGVDLARDLFLAFPLDDGPVPVAWDSPLQLDLPPHALSDKLADRAQFTELPAAASRKASYTKWRRAFVRHVVQNHVLVLFQAPKLKLHSVPGETEEEFRARLAQKCRELRDAEVEKLRARYASRFQTLRDRLLRAEQAVQREREQASAATVQTVVSFGTALLGAFLGRKRVSATSASRLGTAMSRASRTKKQKMDVVRAQERVASIQERLQALQQELERKIAALGTKYDPQTVEVREVRIRPKISDVSLDLFGLGWLPFAGTGVGGLRPAFDTQSE